MTFAGGVCSDGGLGSWRWVAIDRTTETMSSKRNMFKTERSFFFFFQFVFSRRTATNAKLYPVML